MTEAKNEKSQNLLTQKWALLAVLFASPLFLLFAVLGYPRRGRAAGVFGMAMFMAVRAFWKMKTFAWFWVTITTLAALHALLVFLIPWPNGSFPAMALLPIVALDYAIVYGCIKLVQKVNEGKGTADSRT
jgi:hypothetical protein